MERLDRWTRIHPNLHIALMSFIAAVPVTVLLTIVTCGGVGWTRCPSPRLCGWAMGWFSGLCCRFASAGSDVLTSTGQQGHEMSGKTLDDETLTRSRALAR